MSIHETLFQQFLLSINSSNLSMQRIYSKYIGGAAASCYGEFVDEKLMQDVEKAIPISSALRIEFRRQIITYITAMIRKGKEIKWDTHLPLASGLIKYVLVIYVIGTY